MKGKIYFLIILICLFLNIDVFASEVDSIIEYDVISSEDFENISTELSISIPKNIPLNETEDITNYNVTINGVLPGNKKLVIEPESSFLLSSLNKEDIVGLITQDKIEWTAQDLLISANGSIKVSDLSAGEWTGTFNFNISVEEIPYVAGLYNSNDILLASWDELETTYGLDIEANNDVNTPSLLTVINSNEEFSVATKVVVPEKITTLGNYSFYNCANLTDVIFLGDNVTSFGMSAFQKCSNLVNIEIPSKCTKIGSYCFADCKKITKVVIPEGTTILYNNVFWNCYALESVTLPSTLTTIQANAFLYCSGLTSITLPDSLTSMGVSAFCGCSKLDGELVIPEKLTVIPNRAFYMCSNLDSITFKGKPTSFGSTAFSSTNISTIDIPNSVTEIGQSCFYNCKNLSGTITIPGSVKTIGDGIFLYDNKIEAVIIEEGVEELGYNMFYGCSKLSNISLPTSLKIIGKQTFGSCTSLTNITLPDNLIEIRQNAFYNCIKLESIVIPDSVTEIGMSAFRECDKLSSVTLSKNITKIPYSCFYECSSLEDIVIPEGVTSIEDCAFYRCYVAKTSSTTDIENTYTVTIPDSVTHIGDAAFYDCHYMVIGDLPSNLKSIGRGAFYDCGLVGSDLNGTITIPSGVTKIEHFTFYGCDSIFNINGFENITYIGECAFGFAYNTDGTYIPKGLTSITIPSSVTYIGENAFQNTNFLTNKRTETSNGLVIINNILVDGKTYSGTDLIISDSIVSISGSAFNGCTNLTNVTIPSNIIDIGGNAFKGTTWLENKKNENPYVIVNGVLIDGSSVTGAVVIPEGVTIVGEKAFKDNTNITSINTGSAQILKYSAFKGCTGLTNITLIDGNLTTLEEDIFYNCKTSITTLEIPESVTKVGAYAFYYTLDKDSSIYIHNLSTIEKYSFYGCGIKYVYCTSTLNKVCDYSFSANGMWFYYQKVNDIPWDLNITNCWSPDVNNNYYCSETNWK